MTVYVVLHDNYGDQGVDFHGAFASHEAAERFIDTANKELGKTRYRPEEERQYWEIRETLVQE